MFFSIVDMNETTQLAQAYYGLCSIKASQENHNFYFDCAQFFFRMCLVDFFLLFHVLEFFLILFYSHATILLWIGVMFQ